MQPIEAYDVVVANLDPTLARRPPAPDLVAAETALIAAVGEGRAVRAGAGNSSLWSLAGASG